MLWWILQNIIIVAILAAVVSVVCRWKRLSPAARHALWLVVLIKLVTPPLFVWPWAVPISAELVSESVQGEVSQPQQFLLQESELPVMIDAKGESDTETDNLIVSSETFVIPLDAEINPQATSSSTPVLPKLQSGNPPEQRFRWTWERGIFWGSLTWMTGIVLMVLWQGLRIRQMNRLVKNARPAADWLVRLVEETAVLLPVRAPRVLLVSGVSTPMLWAWGKPVLLWPEGLSDQLSSVARRGVVLHELAHLKRKDHWVGRLELLAGCLWWCNPLFWYVRHQLRENAELACDAWVTQTLPEGRRDYADALLTVCENYSHPAVPLPALGMGKSTRRTLERRLTMILRDRVPFRVSGWGVAAVLLLGVLILPGWSQSKQETPQLPEAESAADDVGEEAAPATDEESGSDDELILEPREKRDDVSKSKEKKDNLRVVEIKKANFGVVYTDFDNDGIPDVVVVQGAEDTADETANRNKRLQNLEQKLQALLAELQALQGKKGVSKSKSTRKRSVPLRQEIVGELRGKLLEETNLELLRLNGAIYAAAKPKKQAEVVETKTITLVRTTYRISRVDAKSLEAFLKKIVKSDMLQINVSQRMTPSGNFMQSGAGEVFYEKPASGYAIELVALQTITVTTTPETQQYIGQLIALIERAPQKPSARNLQLGKPRRQDSLDLRFLVPASSRTTGASEPQFEPNAGRESIPRGRRSKSRTTKQEVLPQSNSSRPTKNRKREKTAK